MAHDWTKDVKEYVASSDDAETGTDAAGDWFRDNVDAASWQRLGAVLWIDHQRGRFR